jgi:ATP-binding protein involved in chromosome partitioning
MELNETNVIDILRTIIYPPKDQDIVSLNMISEMSIGDSVVSFSILFDSFNNPHQKAIKEEAIRKMKDAFGETIEVNVRTIGKVNVNKMNVKSAPIKPTKPLENVKDIILVASGKGGVGKSTVASNLAIALSKAGKKVGLLDADMYGPSVPKLLNLEDARPLGRKVDGKDKIVPVNQYGIDVISLGFFVKKEDAVMWRGSMLHNAMKQLIDDVDWGTLDIMVIDLPPGTGDIQLTIAQTLEVSGSVIVTTPEDLAVADVRKAISMFQAKGVDIPVTGLVENMAWFTPTDCPDKKYYLFGKGGAERLSKEMNVPILGQIPFNEMIREDGDKGTPIALKEDSEQAKVFYDIALKVLTSLKKPIIS